MQRRAQTVLIPSLLLLCVATVGAVGAVPQQQAAEDVGMSGDRLARITLCLDFHFSAFSRLIMLLQGHTSKSTPCLETASVHSGKFRS